MGALVVDVADPENPWIVGGVDTPVSAQQVAIANGLAYVADELGGLQILPVQCVPPVTVDDRGGELPSPGLRLAAHPNPFNPRTTVSFALARPAHVTLTVHDLAGRRVTTLVEAGLPAGPHAVTWTGADTAGRKVASGVYVARLVTGKGETASTRMVLIR